MSVLGKSCWLIGALRLPQIAPARRAGQPRIARAIGLDHSLRGLTRAMNHPLGVRPGNSCLTGYGTEFAE